MQKLLTACAIFGLSLALFGCGGETPKPPSPNTETELGDPGALDSPGDSTDGATEEGATDTLDTGSTTGSPEALPPVTSPEGESTPVGDQQAVEGESAATEGPALPKVGE